MMAEEPTVLIYDQIDWDDVLRNAKPGTAPPKELVEQAKKTGARRKKLAKGEGGFYMNRSVLPAGFRIPPHHHNHDELMIVISGSCELDDGVGKLGANDSIVIPAQFRYGITVGSEGMEFITIRTGDSATTLAE
jgi:quercetin dioxygenase-like cupin family protein